MEKITFGDGLPGYITGPADAPALIVLQVFERTSALARRLAQQPAATQTRMLPEAPGPIVAAP